MKSYIKRLILKWRNRSKNITFGTGTRLALSSSFEGYNRIGSNTLFSGKIGYASYIGENCHICAEIGRFCCISSNVVTAGGNHPTQNWVSTHPAFFSTQKQCGMTFVTEQKYEEHTNMILIGNDVWIGNSAIILGGVTIGDGAIVAAGTVVNKNVEPYSIVGGVPARQIKTRFSDSQVEKLKILKWWDKDLSWIQNNADEFACIESFINEVTDNQE